MIIILQLYYNITNIIFPVKCLTILIVRKAFIVVIFESYSKKMGGFKTRPYNSTLKYYYTKYRKYFYVF